MDAKMHYDSASKAIDALNKQGYTVDFNLPENELVGLNAKYNIADFKINDIYRYEGNSDPADEATVYAIESKSGVKGIFVTGYGISEDTHTSLMLEQLKNAKY
jgi:hypothetical protein